MLLQLRYEIILSPNYFITVVYYYRTHPILFLYFFFDPYLFTFLKFFHYWFTIELHVYIHTYALVVILSRTFLLLFQAELENNNFSNFVTC